MRGARSRSSAISTRRTRRARARRASPRCCATPGRLSGQLVTLRAVSTLAMIDVLNYREHVWRLGEYAADGDDARALLKLQDDPDVPTVG